MTFTKKFGFPFLKWTHCEKVLGMGCVIQTCQSLVAPAPSAVSRPPSVVIPCRDYLSSVAFLKATLPEGALT